MVSLKRLQTNSSPRQPVNYLPITPIESLDASGANVPLLRSPLNPLHFTYSSIGYKK